MGKRAILRVGLSKNAKEHLDESLERMAITHVAAISQLVEWFVDQDDAVRACILGLYPKELELDVVKAILERMALETAVAD